MSSTPWNYAHICRILKRAPVFACFRVFLRSPEALNLQFVPGFRGRTLSHDATAAGPTMPSVLAELHMYALCKLHIWNKEGAVPKR